MPRESNQVQTTMKPEEYNELDWLAFQYLTDELSEDERQAFEARLADDQFAREALAKSVDLTQTLAAAESFEQPKPAAREVERRAIRWQRVAWFSATMAGCLALALVYQLVIHRSNATSVAQGWGTGAAKSDAEQLALLWVDQLSLAEPVEPNEQIVGASEIEGESETDEPLEPVDTLGAIGEVETPDWMLAAVLGMSGSANREEGVDMEKRNEKLDN